MSYHIQGDSHWRISKSGYSIKTGFANNSRIVASFHAPVPLDSARFEKWLEDAQHACDLHNASVDAAIKADARITELETAITVRDAEIARMETDLELAQAYATNLRKLVRMRFGYAPGDYSCTCSSCSEMFVGDKRAVTCQKCADAAIDAARKEQTQ